MKVILLAGGRGTRIANLISDVPKCTLKINSVSIIRRTVEIFLKRGIEVIVCTGYKSQLVINELDGLNVRYYNNPFFAITNSVGTLWFAKQELNDDVFIMNADVFFDEQILNNLLNMNNSVSIAVDKSRALVGDYCFSLDEENNIVKYGKTLSDSDKDCEYVGIISIKKEFLPLFLDKFNNLIENEQYNLWWENILYSLSDDGYKIKTIDCSDYFWSEVDTYDDYLRILKHFDTKN